MDARLTEEIEKVCRLLEGLRKVQSRSWYRMWKDDGGYESLACSYCHCWEGTPHGEDCPFVLIDEMDPQSA